MKLRHVLMAGTAVLAFSGQAYADGHAKVIQSKSKAVVAISGQIQRTAAFIDDGSSQRVRHMEHGQSESGIDIKGSTAVNSNLKASFHIDMDVDTQQQNSDGTVQGGFAGEVSGDINTPKVNMSLAHKSLGTMTIGRTGAAADGVAHNSVHGAFGFSQGLLLNNIVDTGLRDSDDGTQSGNTVGDVMSGALGDPGGRSPMIRYDTPRVGGFAAAVSHEYAGHASFGATYGGSVGPLKVSIKTGYHNGDGDANNVLGVSGAIKHSSGLGGGYAYTFSMDGVESTVTADQDVHQQAAQVFYQAKFNEMGSTTFMGEWQQARDLSITGSEGNAFSVGLSQNVDSAAISFYAKYIHVDVKAPGENFDDVQAVDTGIRMKF